MTINGNLRNAPAEATTRPRTCAKFQQQLVWLWLWLWLWFPNGVLMRCQIGGQYNNIADWVRRMRASVQITLNHALTMSTGPQTVELSCLGQDQFGSNPLFQVPSRAQRPSVPGRQCFIHTLRYLRSARLANEFLFTSDSSECSQSSRHSHWLFMVGSTLCRLCDQLHRSTVLLISGSPIIT